MTRYRGHVFVALAGVALVLLWPLTAALSSRESLVVRIATAMLVVIACAAAASWHRLRGRAAVAVSLVSALLGVTLLLMHFDALDVCIADFQGRPVIIGTTFSPDAATYLRDNPGLSLSDRLLDIGGAPDRLWTAESIRMCRLRVSWAGLAAIPLLAVSAATLLSGRRYTLPANRPAAAAPATASIPVVYDAFLSYRHAEPDRTIAAELVDSLEANGLRLAIDVRDFSPNEHFLSEMERCVKQSRFVLCIVTAQWVESSHTSEEAIISKTLDLADRRRRLIPLIFERVELPVWLHGLVGIDFTPGATVDPQERLMRVLTTKSGPG